jgi:hypothetical protein
MMRKHQNYDENDEIDLSKSEINAEYRMKNPMTNLSEGVKGRSRDKLGSIAKVSGRTYQNK